ncbi:MAG: hypothetical protein L0H59_02660 [Tomitella sp.]|nr:hypothetical protein [Tomitella sp.]
MGTPEHVELLYDPVDRRVGIRAAAHDAPHSYIARRPSKGADTGPVMIAGRAFTGFYDIDVTVTRRFPAHMDDDVLCFDLDTGTRIVGNRGRRRHSDAHDAP